MEKMGEGSQGRSEIQNQDRGPRGSQSHASGPSQEYTVKRPLTPQIALSGKGQSWGP